MKIGPAVRRRLGRFERCAAEAYRRPFINLDDLALTLSHMDGVDDILEVGAGDGAFASRLVDVYPKARYLGVDIIPSPGRLFVGDLTRAAFQSLTVEELPAGQEYDLVLLVDVLHHVPAPQRCSVLAASARLVRPGGHLVIKEWEASRSAAQLLWFVADRWIGGDVNVKAFAPLELQRLVASVCPQLTVKFEGRVPPLRNNFLLVLQRT